MKKLKTLLTGQRISGEVLPKPTYKTTTPPTQLSPNDWANEFKVGSRFGHRGSFYQPDTSSAVVVVFR